MTKLNSVPTSQPRLILASQSPQRRLMLATTGLDFEIIPADLDELAITAPTHIERAAKIAGAKARAVAESLEKTGSNERLVILAADTYLIDEATGRALEKPVDLAEAREMLNYQSGKIVSELTGAAFYDSSSGEIVTETTVTEVKFRHLSAEEIERLVTTQPVTTWSGAFSPAYPEGAALIESIKGSMTGFSHGFPMEFFGPLLRQAGFAI